MILDLQFFGGRGASSGGSGGDSYIRFGDVPGNEKSLNWFALSFDQQSDVEYELSYGVSLEEALKRAGVDLNKKGLFEEGVSVFKLDSDGLPKIDNLQQLETMSERIGQKVYTMKGKQRTTGTDNEPVIGGVKGKKEVNISDKKLEDKITSVLKKNYKTAEKATADYGKLSITDGYTDFNGNKVPHSVTYKGVTYTNPVKSWDTRRGYDIYKKR